MTLQAKPEADCRGCGKPFLRFRTTQAACSPRCAMKTVKADKKTEAEQTRARRVALKSRRDWIAEAQKAFNRWTRLRDFDAPCISCGKLAAAWGSWDAGHYLTTGARPELRFTPDNCHKQCVRCNQHLHGNAAMYRIGLVARIGLERVEALEGPHPPAKWSVDELKTIRDGYRLMAKLLLEQPPEPPARSQTASPAPDTADAPPSTAPADRAPGPASPPRPRSVTP